MTSVSRFTALAAIIVMGCSIGIAQSKPLSERVVAYQIDARFNPSDHTLDATETLTYVNRTGQPQQRFPFHLYLNAFQPKSTFMTETHRSGVRDVDRGSDWKDKNYGSEEIKSFEAVGMGDLTKQIKFIAPDDGNADDRTVMEVQLPKPVAPGETVTFKIAFHDKFPEVIARTGDKRTFTLGGQWFPKVGVWWQNAWNCHQFHATTEFFADFGTFDVKLTVPQNYNVGATGTQVSANTNSDGTKTLEFHADDVHDFAWTADPTTRVINDEVQLNRGPVKIHVFMQPGHMSSAQRYIDALKGTMKKFEEWYGPYPYPQITVVDPPHGGAAAGGMEYPMFITADTNWWTPRSLLMPEMVVEHEYGHQYWYGMVASNEFEDAWLDEGINSYTEIKVMQSLYGRGTSMINSRIGTAGDTGVQRLQYLIAPDLDPLTRNAWQFESYGSYGGNTYGKTATMLVTLEQIVGEDKLRQALHEYFLRFRFKHPTEQDFMTTVNEVTGQNLDWYWNQAVRGTEVFDYRILSTNSSRVDWYDKNRAPAKKGSTIYRSSVVVHRRGDFVFPVILEVKFDNGETVRETWDGQDRWHRFTWDKKAKLISAELDPDHHLMLDKDLFNNSWTKEPDTRATQKIGFYWTYLTQWLAQMLTWLA